MPAAPSIPQEIQDILDVMNENIGIFITNRERITALFDNSLGLSAKSLIPANNWTLLRDLWTTELNDAVSSLQSTISQIQNLQ